MGRWCLLLLSSSPSLYCSAVSAFPFSILSHLFSSSLLFFLHSLYCPNFFPFSFSLPLFYPVCCFKMISINLQPFLHLFPLSSTSLSPHSQASPLESHFVHPQMQFFNVVILLRPHTAVETLSGHDMSQAYWFCEHKEGKGPVVVVFNSFWAVRYIHMAPSQHCAPQSPLDEHNADRNQLDPLMKGTPGWTLPQTWR